MRKERKTLYQYLKVSGSAYEVGRQLGRMLKDNSALIEDLTHPFMGQNGLVGEELQKIQNVFEEYCPGTNEEIRGFADEVGANYGDIVYYFAYLRPMECNCSLVAVTPELTQSGTGMMARNYEFGWDDSSILIETQIENQYRQIGFGCQVFGRFDGMNEHGLCIATAAGVINPPYDQEGFVFPVIVRAILNQCKTVEEAIKVFEKMKIADYRNIMIMDAKGDSVLIEATAHDFEVIKAGRNETKKLLYATNHFESEKLAARKYYCPKNSLLRYDAVEQSLQKKRVEHGLKISEDDVKELLTQSLPSGVYCNYYEDGMGTMWSILFHPEQKKIEVCFGGSNQNQWKVYDFNEKVKNEIQKYNFMLQSEIAPDGFWNNMI